MYRTFDLTLTASYKSVWDSIVASGFCDSTGTVLSGGNRTNQIIVDRVSEFDLRPGDTNTGDVTIADRQQSTGFILTNLSKRSNRNTICLKDYFAKGSDTSQVLVVEIESI